ncbi:acyl-[ACP]--phospholipid O-acyltransferase [Vibrio owensii]|uniref:acyl-[ACP]--phospholipid O-acyltransferase n=1 Tax=Vibrio owensii TaxID=696485 RepID=UPI003CC5BBB2
MKQLLLSKGFGALLLAMFLNAFVDIGQKVILQNIVLKTMDGSMQLMLTAIINGLILLPFLLCFSPSAFVSDRFNKESVMKWSAASAVVLSGLVAFCYWNGSFELALVACFLLAVQSTFYSPAKYGYLKELVGNERLAQANGLGQATVIVAILLSASVFSFGFEKLWIQGAGETTTQAALLPLAGIMIVSSMIELFATTSLPKVTKPNPEMKFDKKAYVKGQLLKENVKLLNAKPALWQSVLGLSVFWMFSQMLLAIYPTVAEAQFGTNDSFVIQSIMACSGVGILVGSLFAGRVSRDYIETGLIPIGVIGVSISLMMLSGNTPMKSHSLMFFALGFSGALFTVPLNALLQYHSKPETLGSSLASANFIQNLFMVSGLALTFTFAYLSLEPKYLFMLMSGIAAVGAVYVIRLMPYSAIRIVITTLMRQRYRLKIVGFENIPVDGGALLLGNHVSFVDWAMIQMSTPRKVKFVIERSYYQKWYLKWILDLVGVIPVSSGNSKQALKDIAAEVNNGELVCLFPEGALSRHGQLNEFKKGFERAAKEIENGVIIPFYLHGLWGSAMSRSSEGLKEKRKRFLKRNVVIVFGQEMPIESTRDQVKQKVSDLSFTAWDVHSKTLGTVGYNFIRSCKQYASKVAITDPMTGQLTYSRLLVGAALMAKAIKKQNRRSSSVGLILPASSAVTIANMGAMLAKKTVVNLNFTASPSAFTSAIEQSEITSVYTSKRFIEKLKRKGIEPNLDGLNVYFLEEMTKQFKEDKFTSLATAIMLKVLPAKLIAMLYVRSVKREDVAAILFSSGSEGAPKGVCLTHQNFMSNIYQMSDLLNSNGNDAMLASLPPFHAFGLTATTIAPVLDGIHTVCCADPTDAVTVGKLVAKHNVTMLFGTSTFLRIYARNRKVHPLMFDSLRYVIAGAERLSDEVRMMFESKFNKPIYEGYGCTETTPIACINVPDHLDKNYWNVHVGQKRGTVGMAVPGTTIRVVDPETMKTLPAGEDGLILIGGHQIMAGYLKQPEKTSEAVCEMDGIRFYKTGDKGHVDVDGFLTIVDRYSRFAKLGGEMVSLGAVEREINAVITSRHPELADEIQVVATAIPDEAKGEVVVLLAKTPEDFDLRKLISESGIAPIMQPKTIVRVDEMPLLGSGKVDLKKAKMMAMEV